MKITLLVDLQEHETLSSEFGLSFLLESADGDFLFDTGSGKALIENLAKLNIPSSKVRQVILSHGHYDHTGGLAYLEPQKIFCCPNIAQSHYSWHSQEDIHNITMPPEAQKVLEQTAVEHIEKFTRIAENIYLTGPIPRNSMEDCGGKFFHDKKCTLPDVVSEEQSLLTADGILISGCCHAGIINTVEYCRKIHPEIVINTIIGGLHLRQASPERLQATVNYLNNSSVKTLCLLHCTGNNAIDFLRQSMPDRKIFSLHLGEQMEF